MNDVDVDKTVNFYLTVFGWLQIFCLLVAPAIGSVLDRNLSQAVDDPVQGGAPLDENIIFRKGNRLV